MSTTTDLIKTDPPQAVQTHRTQVSSAMGRGIAWTAAQMVGSNLLSLVVFVVLGRLLSPRDFGLLASATVVVLFLRVLVDAGFSRLIVQRETISPEHVNTAFWTALLIGTAFCVLLVAAAPLVALMFGEPGLTNIVRALSIVFIFVALDGTQSALLERRMEFRSQAIRRLVAGTASAAAAIGLALIGAGVWALVAQQLVLEGVTVIVLWTLAPWRPSLRVSRAAFRDLASFGVRYSGSQVLLYLGGNMDNFLIGIVLGPVALGFYVIAYRVLVVATEVLVLTINRVALTTFSRFQRDNFALNNAFVSATGMTAFITLPCFAALAFLAHPLITTVFGAKWAPSVPVLQVLTVAGVIQGQSNFTGNYAIAVGRMNSQLVWMAGLVSVQLIAFGATVHFGIVAVAASYSAVLLIGWPIRLRQISRWRGLHLRRYFAQFARLLLPTAALVAAMWAVGTIIHAPPAALLAAQILVGGFFYLAWASMFAPAQTAQLRTMLTRQRE